MDDKYIVSENATSFDSLIFFLKQKGLKEGKDYTISEYRVGKHKTYKDININNEEFLHSKWNKDIRKCESFNEKGVNIYTAINLQRRRDFNG